MLSRLRLHLPLLVGVPGCLAAGWFELGRARAGRQVAWVYAIEWPLFAVMGIYIWWRVLQSPDGARAAPPAARAAAADERQLDGEDPALTAWSAYLSDLHASDPPGGPPAPGHPAGPP